MRPALSLRTSLLIPAIALALAACGGGDDDTPAALAAPTLSFTPPTESLDLSNYTLTGRYTLPATSGATQIAAEVSAVTYDETTDSLFIVGDEGTYITRISKTGQVLDTMALPAGLFADPEGITAIGGGRFVVADERVRTANLLSYQAGTTLDAATVRSVKLGPTVGNVGLEGVSFDPLTGGYVFVKELTPKAIFQTAIDFNAGTATNGSATTEPTNLFDPDLLTVADFGDIHALSNTLPTTAADRAHLIVLSNDTGRILKVDRSGRVYGSLDIRQSAQHEGITFDRQLNMYVTNEAGGGSQALPQLWVYTPTRNAAAVGLGSHLYLSFGANVTTGTGNITLVGSGGDTRSIAVTDTTQVSISGATVRINPTADLTPNTTYSVQFASGVFRDANGNAFAGITDATGLNFITAGTTPPTTLAAGDLLFLAVNGDSPDAFAFMLMRDITAGTQIGFSDRDSLSATNESAFMWTADQAYAAGTIVTVQTDVSGSPVADRGQAIGTGGGVSTSSETIFAFQGSIVTTPAPTLVVERYLAAINMGTASPLDATLQTALNGSGAFIAFSPDDNVRYGGTLSIADPAALRASIANTANWVRNDSTAFPLTGGSLFP